MTKNSRSVIVVGDLHVDARTLPGGSWGDPEMCRRRNMSIFTGRTMQTIHDLVEDNSAAAVIFTGDIFDTGKPLVSDAITVQRELAGIKTKVIVVTGNHDIKGLNSADENPLVQLFSDDDNITVVAGKTVNAKIGGTGITLLPWPDEGSSFDKLVSDAKGSDVIIGHANIDGMAGKRDSLSSKTLKRKWSKGIFGHVHTPADGDYMYVGASKQNSLEPGAVETVDDNFIVAQLDGGKVSVTRKSYDPGFNCVVAGVDDIIDSSNVDGVVIEGDSDGKLSEFREAGIRVTRRPARSKKPDTGKHEPLKYDGKDFDIINAVVSALSDGTDTTIAREELAGIVDNY